MILMARVLLACGFFSVIWMLFKLISALAFGLAELLARTL